MIPPKKWYLQKWPPTKIDDPQKMIPTKNDDPPKKVTHKEGKEEEEEEEISLLRINLQVNTNYLLVWVSAIISERS